MTTVSSVHWFIKTAAEKLRGFFAVTDNGNIGACLLHNGIHNLLQSSRGFVVVAGIPALLANESRHVFDNDNASAHVNRKSGKAVLYGFFAHKTGHLFHLPDLRHGISRDVFVVGNERRRFVKVFRHAEPLFYGGRLSQGLAGCFYGSKRKYNRPRRHFDGNVDCQTAVIGNFHGFCNAHGANIA